MLNKFSLPDSDIPNQIPRYLIIYLKLKEMGNSRFAPCMVNK